MRVNFNSSFYMDVQLIRFFENFRSQLMAERNRLVSATARVLQDRHGVRDPLTASQLAQTALARRSRGRDAIQLLIILF